LTKSGLKSFTGAGFLNPRLKSGVMKNRIAMGFSPDLRINQVKFICFFITFATFNTRLPEDAFAFIHTKLCIDPPPRY